MDANEVGRLLHFVQIALFLLPALIVVAAGALVCVGVALGRGRG